MTTYLSSFIIDPVVRQVRRLSSSGAASVDTRTHDDDGLRRQDPPPIVTTTTKAGDRRSSVASVTEEPHDEDEEYLEDAARRPFPDAQSAHRRPIVESPDLSPSREAVMRRSPILASETSTVLVGQRRRGGSFQISDPSPTLVPTVSLRSRARTIPITTHTGPIVSTLEHDTTNNPSFGVPDRFLTEHPSTTPGPIGSQTYGVVPINSRSPAEGRRSRSSTANSMIESSSGEEGGEEEVAPGADQSGATRIGGTRGRNGSLPADDGRGDLRRRILEIQENQHTSSDEKARSVHILMTEPYHHFHPNLHLVTLPRSSSSAVAGGVSGSAHSPTDEHGNRSASPATVASIAADLNSSLTAEDIAPTYMYRSCRYRSKVYMSSTWIPGATEDSQTDNSRGDDEDEGPALGCQHYKRNVKIQCSICSKWYICRFCHNAAEDHELIRKETKNMLCVLCGYAQPVGEDCTNCGQRTACYYCGVCKLWDDDNTRTIYHCNDCGICRIGRGLGKDFYHCNTCGVCMSISIADSHRCIERSTDCDCPICGDYMFTSPLTVVFMQCGHSIHLTCYYAHMQSSYKCPICSRSIINMEVQFRKLDQSIESQPMPPEHQDTKALVYCNDCRAKSSVQYHWLGLKCGVCDSYNTVQIQLIRSDAPPSPEPPAQATSVDEAAVPQSDDTLVLPRPSEAERTNDRVIGRPTSTSVHGSSASVQVSPYGVPVRTGRSVLPLAVSNEFRATPLPSDAAVDIQRDSRMVSDDEEDEVEFWGGESRGRRRADPGQPWSVEDIDRRDDDHDISSDDEVDDDVDVDVEGEEEDAMELFGHP